MFCQECYLYILHGQCYRNFCAMIIIYWHVLLALLQAYACSFNIKERNTNRGLKGTDNEGTDCGSGGERGRMNKEEKGGTTVTEQQIKTKDIQYFLKILSWLAGPLL